MRDLKGRHPFDAAIFVGLPGSYKGTVNKAICGSSRDRNRPIHIEMSRIIKLKRAVDPKFDQLADSMMASGILLPDSHIMGILNDYLSDLSHDRVWSFDGVPRNWSQACRLDHFLMKRKYHRQVVFYLQTTEDQARANILQRAVKEDREDDQNPEVVQNRLDTFKSEIDLIIGFYRERKIEIVEIDCSPGSPEVIRKVKEKLGLH